MCLGLRPRESGQLSTIISQNHGITTRGAIFLCEKLPRDGCELVLAIHRSRATIDAEPFELRAKRS